MPDPIFSDREKECVQLLAGMLEGGKLQVHDGVRKIGRELLKIEKAEYLSVMRMMEAVGAIEKTKSIAGDYESFEISAKAIQFSREIKAKKEGDVVSKFNESVRKSKYGAMAIIVVLALTTLATMVSQLLNILEKFGLTPRWLLERIAQ